MVVASGVDDHASYMGESFAAKHLECALAPASAKSLEEAAKAWEGSAELQTIVGTTTIERG